MIARRSFIAGIIAACAAPAIVRSGLIMPVKAIAVPDAFQWTETFAITAVSDSNLTFSLDEYAARVLKPAISVLASNIQTDILRGFRVGDYVTFPSIAALS